MTQVVNLTMLCLLKKIDIVLNSYPQVYRIAFKNPDLRQKLIAFVLNGVNNRHMLVENLQELPKESFFPACPHSEMIELEKLIRAGIDILWTKNQAILQC